MTRTVFISHSCEDRADLTAAQRQTRARARQVRDEIEQGLAGIDGLTAWIDKDELQPGQEWRREIHKELFRCSAGVILLDDEAFRSPWVLKETTVLSVRSSLLAGFPLVPVLLDQGSSDAFDKRPDWKALGMREIQALKVPPYQVASKVIEIVKGAAEVSEITPFERWVERVFALLLPYGLLKLALSEIAQGLQVPVSDDWTADDHRDLRTLALALVASDDLERVIMVVRELSFLPDESREKLESLLTPTWVKPQRAAVAAAGLRDKSVGQRLVLESEDEHVAMDHLNRAECFSGKLRVFRVATAQGEDATGELLFQDCVASIEKDLPQAQGRRETLFAEFLSKIKNPPLVLCVAPGAMQVGVLRDVLNRVQHEFPGLGILLMTNDVENLAAGLDPPTPRTLLPYLTTEDIDSRSAYAAELALFAKGSI